MTRTHLSIDRLRIRVRGASAEAARAAAAGLGPDLLNRLLPQLGGAVPPAAPAVALDLGVKDAPAADTASLRAAMADALAAGIRSRIENLPSAIGGRGLTGGGRP